MEAESDAGILVDTSFRWESAVDIVISTIPKIGRIWVWFIFEVGCCRVSPAATSHLKAFFRLNSYFSYAPLQLLLIILAKMERSFINFAVKSFYIF